MKNRSIPAVRLSLPFTAVILAASAPALQAQLYYKSTTAANAWTGSFWGTSAGGPFTGAWTSGSNVVFVDNLGTSLALTGATTNFASITANESVNVTAGGTIGTGGTVATITVAAGKNLNFGGQVFSSAVGTGFIKNGDGILTLAGGTYAGGFTLNAGTVAVGGINAMGDGGTLTINGGTIRSNSTTARNLTDKYDTGIVIGGDFVLGDATNNGALTFSNNVALGSVNRIITAASAATFGGIFSGDSGVGFTKSGAGQLRLNGANTFTGAITVNGGDLTIGNYSGLDLNSSLITVSGGTAGLNVAQVGTGTTTDSYSQNLSLHGFLRTIGGSSTNRLNLTWGGNITLAGASTITNNGNSLIDIDGIVDLGAHNLIYQADGASSRIDGKITGSGGSLTKTSAQDLTVSNILNDYTGGTSITGGSLSFANGALGTTGNITVNGATLTWATGNTQDISSRLVLQNSGSATFNTNSNIVTLATGFGSSASSTVTKSGAGTLTLSGNNSYTGLTSVTGGVLNIQHADALGTATGDTSVTGGELQVQGGINVTSEALNLSTSTVTSVVRLRNVSGDNTWGGAIAQVGGGASHLTRIQSDLGTVTLSGQMGSAAAASSYVFQGAGNITVSGKITGTTGVIGGSVGASATSVRTLSNDTSDFTGRASVSGGVLAFTSVANAGTASALGAGTDTPIIGLASGTSSATLRYIGTDIGGHTTTRAINLGSGTSGAHTATIEANGAGALVLGTVSSDTAGAKTLVLSGINAGNNSIGAITPGTATSVSLTKDGTGTWILGTTNTYTGATNVNNGKLVVNGSISTSTLTTVASGATLGGSGTVGPLTIASGGSVTPGNSPGILTVNGNYTQAGLYTAEINGLTPGNLASNHDQISVTGTVDITGGSLSTLFTGSYSLSDMIFILLNDGADSITGTYSGLAQGATVTNYGGFDWQISYLGDSGGSPTFTGGNDIVLMAVPEPDVAALLGGLGMLALVRRRR